MVVLLWDDGVIGEFILSYEYFSTGSSFSKCAESVIYFNVPLSQWQQDWHVTGESQGWLESPKAVLAAGRERIAAGH